MKGNRKENLYLACWAKVLYTARNKEHLYASVAQGLAHSLHLERILASFERPNYGHGCMASVLPHAENSARRLTGTFHLVALFCLNTWSCHSRRFEKQARITSP